MDLKLDCLYTSCGLLKKILLYILMLHLSRQCLCIMARHSLLLVYLYLLISCHMLGWALRMVNEKVMDFGVAP